METKNPNILSKQMMRFEGLTLPQLLSLILLNNDESAMSLWYLLSVRLKDNLRLCYDQSTSESEAETFKTFDDYLTDFYIYLYEGHPDYVNHPTQFHYLQTIQDNTKIDPWVQRCFKMFLSNERRALSKLAEALPAYIQEMKAEQLRDPAIELTRIAFSLAWYNQFESVEDRYIFFRSMKKKVVKSFRLDAELNDQETAQALGMKYATFRSRVSRCCKEVQRLMTEMTQADIAKLDANSLLLVDRISNINEDTLVEIIDSLVAGAERQLPQYNDILEARVLKEEKQNAVFEERLSEIVDYSRAPKARKHYSQLGSALPNILSGFIPTRKKTFQESCAFIEEQREDRRQSFVETFVSNFMSFIES